MRKTCRLAAIADDFTGGADLAGMLHENGARTVQVFGLQPDEFFRTLSGRYEAAVLSLKSRSVPAADACRMSVDALDRLELLSPAQFQFKYCSTFDSTREGNIGPVTARLMERLGVEFTVAVPALPVNGRTQYLGHLFVGSQLLSESHLRYHPVTPMTDANLVRFLQRQTARRVGLIPLGTVEAGPAAIQAEARCLQEEGISIALVDAVSDRHLVNIAEAVAGMRLITGGSGIGGKLAAAWRSRGFLGPAENEIRDVHRSRRRSVVLSGSCSAATLRQVRELAASGCVMVRMDVESLVTDPEREVDRLFEAAASPVDRDGVAAIYSSAPPELRPVETAPETAERIEWAFGELARRFVVDAGVSVVVAAGGETAGAIVGALRIPAVEITGILDPGVPSLRALGTSALRLALKSGNFGSPDFFMKAVRRLEDQ